MLRVGQQRAGEAFALDLQRSLGILTAEDAGALEVAAAAGER